MFTTTKSIPATTCNPAGLGGKACGILISNAPTQYFTFTNHCRPGSIVHFVGCPGGGIYIGPDKGSRPVFGIGAGQQLSGWRGRQPAGTVILSFPV